MVAGSRFRVVAGHSESLPEVCAGFLQAARLELHQLFLLGGGGVPLPN